MIADAAQRQVVVTDQSFGGTAVEAEIARTHGAQFGSHQCASEAETLTATAGADVVLVNFAPITASVLTGLASGATVIRYGIGYDNVDTDAAQDLGIQVANVPDYGAETVADHAAACLLALLRRLPHYDRRIRRDGWSLPGDVGALPGLSSTTVGLIGAGRTALSLARRLRAFGIRVVADDPAPDEQAVKDAGVELVTRDQLLATAQAVSLHAPATASTYHLVDESFLAALQPGTALVNTSRGSLVHEQALAAALQSGHLSGAALDVFEPEPLAPDSPLRQCTNILFTPHAAFYSVDSLQALQRLAAEEAGRALTGAPLRCRVA